MSGAGHSCGVPGMKFRRLLIPGIAAALLALAGCGPQNPDGLVASAKGYIAKSDEKAAIVQLKSALQKDPDHAEARLLLGQMLLATGDPNGASVERATTRSCSAPSYASRDCSRAVRHSALTSIRCRIEGE